MTFTLSDKTIAVIAKLVQVGILTGTDIVDNLRTLRVEADGELLNPTDSFLENLNRNIENLLTAAANGNEDTL